MIHTVYQGVQGVRVVERLLLAESCLSDTNRWTFATGELIDITAIGEQFGLYFWKESGTISHNVRTIVLDTKGRVHWTTKENDWKPAVLVEEIVKAAAVK